MTIGVVEMRASLSRIWNPSGVQTIEMGDGASSSLTIWTWDQTLTCSSLVRCCLTVISHPIGVCCFPPESVFKVQLSFPFSWLCLREPEPLLKCHRLFGNLFSWWRYSVKIEGCMDEENEAGLGMVGDQMCTICSWQADIVVQVRREVRWDTHDHMLILTTWNTSDFKSLLNFTVLVTKLMLLVNVVLGLHIWPTLISDWIQRPHTIPVCNKCFQLSSTGIWQHESDGALCHT